MILILLYSVVQLVWYTMILMLAHRKVEVMWCTMIMMLIHRKVQLVWCTMIMMLVPYVQCGTVGVVYHDTGSGAGEPCGVRAAIEANLRCIDQSCFFQTFFNPFLQTD